MEARWLLLVFGILFGILTVGFARSDHAPLIATFEP